MSLVLDLTPLDWGESMSVKQACRLYSPCCRDIMVKVYSFGLQTPVIYCSSCLSDVFKISGDLAILTMGVYPRKPDFSFLNWRY